MWFSGLFKKETQSNEPLQPIQGLELFKTKEDVITFINNEFDKRQKDRKSIELQWNLNMNFLMSNQYCDINLTSGEVEQLDRLYDWQEREPYNHIAPIYETRLAKLKKIKPSPHVRPVNQSTQSESTARVSKAVLCGLDKSQNMEEKRSLATAWSEICGCCFIESIWRNDKGRLIGNLDGEDVFEGDIHKDIVTPFEIFPDSLFAQGIEGCRSIIRAKAYHKDVIFDTWGIEVKGKSVDVFNLSQTAVGTGGLGYNASIFGYTKTTVDDNEIVIEYMELPSRRRPQGLHIITAGNDLLYFGPYIYKVGENGEFAFPFVMQVCIESPGHFWPASVIERLIPVQRSYNAVKNRKHEMLNRKAIGVLVVEDDGNGDTEDLEEEGLYPGKILTHARGATAPTFLSSRDSTVDFENEEASLEQLFVTISGVSTFASQSATPSGNNSGTALEIVKESDDTRIGLTAENINIAAIKSYKIDLRMYRQFVQTPRVTRYVGKNNAGQVDDWVASDLSSDDIVVEKEDEAAQTPAQRRETVKELLQYKLFSGDTEPKIRSKVIKLLELGDWENADDIEDSHISKALRENMLAKQGTTLIAKEYDMHDLHIQEHNRWRLDVEYEELEQQQPQMVQLFNDHVAQHEAFIQAKMQQAMIMQQSQLAQAQ